jgi:zinc transport system permease protein
MFELLQYDFMQNAFVAAVLVSIACGIVGTYVVTKKIVFISGGISHTAFGGIGLGYLLGISPILVAIPFSLLAAVGIGVISRRTVVSEDTAIGILWTVGMALGIIFINLSPGYAPDLFSYLFGNILTVPRSDLLVMLVLDLVIIGAVSLFYREFYALSFDEEFATVIGMPTRLLSTLLLCLVALSVVVLIRVVGIILVIALLTIPVAIARQYVSSFKALMALSVVTGTVMTVSGLTVSYFLDLASGATIVILLGAVFGVTSLLKRSRV